MFYLSSPIIVFLLSTFSCLIYLFVPDKFCVKLINDDGEEKPTIKWISITLEEWDHEDSSFYKYIAIATSIFHNNAF